MPHSPQRQPVDHPRPVVCSHMTQQSHDPSRSTFSSCFRRLWLVLTDDVVVPFQAFAGVAVLQLLAHVPLRHPGESPVTSCDLSRQRQLMGGCGASPQELQAEMDVHWPSLLKQNSSFHFWYDPTTIWRIHPPGKLEPGPNVLETFISSTFV